MQLDGVTPIDVGLLLLRLSVGLTFAAHGAQKALGWWGGPGFAGWTGAIGKMRFAPAQFWAVVSAYVELLGGLSFAAGLLTAIGSALLFAQALVIVFRVHLPKGFWNRNSGVEFPLQLLAGSALVLLGGPGALSVDAALALRIDAGLRLLIAALAVLGVLLAVASARLATDL